MMSLLLWTILLTFVASPITAQGAPRPTVTRTVGPPTCVVHTTTNKLTTTLPVQLNDDEITIVKGCRRNLTTDVEEYANCTGRFFEANGKKYLEIVSVVDLENPTDEFAENACGFTRTPNGAAKWKYDYKILLKRYEHFLMYGDLAYKWTCDPDKAIQGQVEANFEVTDQFVETLEPSNPVITFKVIEGGNTDEITQCEVGDNVRVMATMTHPDTYEDYKFFYGMYFYNMYIARTTIDLMTRTRATKLTNEKGCIEGSLLGRNLFYEPSLNTSANEAVYVSGTLKCQRFFDTNTAVIGTSLSFCRGEQSSLINTNDKCYDFCAFNNIDRKRRDVTAVDEIPSGTVHATLTIIDSGESTEKSDGLSQTTVIIVAVALSVLVLALIITFGCFMVWMNRGSGSKGDGSWDSSRASSDRKLPLQY